MAKRGDIVEMEGEEGREKEWVEGTESGVQRIGNWCEEVRGEELEGEGGRKGVG